MIHDLEEVVNTLHQTPSDINEHFPAILKYGGECDHITEMGVRWIVSTWGWLACSPKKLISYDIADPSNWNSNIQDVYDTAEAYGLNFEFKLADVLKTEIEETDLLFLDTAHVYAQVKAELELHSNKVRKYICFHDTTSYEINGEDGVPGNGIWKAIQEFLDSHKEEWVIEKRFTNNNGFTIIKRIN
jgi:cephalosporin hydroxylase